MKFPFIRFALPGLTLGLLLTPVACLAQAGLRVEVGGRGSSDAMTVADGAVRRLNKNFAVLSKRTRAYMGKGTLLTLPTPVLLTRNGVPLTQQGRGRGNDITLVFDTSGERAFPLEYQQFLQNVFDRAKPTITALFGDPSVGGNVRVANYDADIGERDAVAGGYYVPNNGDGDQEIRFPVYADAVGYKLEATAVNFIHTLLLAYIGPKQLPNDAFEEGLVRGVVLRIARNPSSLPVGLDPVSIENVLDSTYDIGPYYDWNNQRALASRLFIAPNLRSQALPPGGSVGGLYLLRYQMAGSAWQKALVEYPSFAAEFLRRYYADTNSYQTRDALASLGQATLDALAGPGSTVEGLSFNTWLLRQYILNGSDAPGPKVLIQPFAVTSGLSGNDFGVFGVQVHYFSQQPNGNETLLSGTSFPIFWSPDFTRFFTSGQEDRIDIAAGYGAAVPNFPDSFSFEPYRVTVDTPVLDRISRVYLPAGAIATAQNQTENTLYGTIVGGESAVDVSYKLRVSWPGGSADPIPVSNFAFGVNVTDAAFLGGTQLTVDVVRMQGGSETTVLSRKVNKGPGPIGLDLRIDTDHDFVFPTGITKGLQLIGLPIEPYLVNAAEVFGFNEPTPLIARYDASLGRYRFFPAEGTAEQGLAYYVRSDASRPLRVSGRQTPNTPVAVALRPGWNLISNPLPIAVGTSSVTVVTAADFPFSWSEAAGTLVGGDFFGFTPGPPDGITGAPETGTLNLAGTFEVGKGYLVRVIAPDGVSLLFSPVSRSRDGGNDRERKWEVQAELTGGAETAAVRIGMSERASRDSDRLDTPLPPRIVGGLRGYLGGAPALFRDTRGWSKAETFKVTFEGLKPGKAYTLLLDRIGSTTVSLRIKDTRSGKVTNYPSKRAYAFTPREASRTFQIQYGGGW